MMWKKSNQGKGMIGFSEVDLGLKSFGIWFQIFLQTLIH